MHHLEQILQSRWGYSSFRPLQKEIIESVLSGKDTLALMPTGGGKSLCYQVPAMAIGGLCLVVSPLIALMKDQVENLRKKSITAFAIYSGMTRKEVINTLEVSANSNCRFLYVSPERLETSLFKEYLPALGIQLIAVDEAHCISQWGYDFRPPYLRIARLREELPGIPVLALTASATPEVQQDICDKLDFRDGYNVFRQSFERPNLSYSVFNVDSKINKIIDIIQKVPGTGIVYCKSRRRTKEISDLLRMHGISSDYYHAGLTNDERAGKQEAWMKNKVRTVVCTNAFGMGIDKPDVRVVVHADVPDCLENYYQEAGRAGRDGKRAYAVLLYNGIELEQLEKLPDIRFPSIDSIREVYQALMNYLQVPVHSGAGNYYDFDLADFLKKFKLDAQLVMATLKALEQENMLAFNEQVFLSAKVQFTTNKEELYDFEKNYPNLEPLVKAMLRTYEGVFDFPVNIHEKSLAYQLKADTEEIKKRLRLLDGYRIIEYQPQKDQPQLYFVEDRRAADSLQINHADYRKRKNAFALRIGELTGYINKEVSCRSSMIAAYFGDEAVQPCGICDNCLKKNKEPITKEEFENINEKIVYTLSQKPVSAHDLFGQLKGIKKEKAWQVIDFLQAENKIRVDKNGLIELS